MASKDKESPGADSKRDDPSDKSKRPSRVIDLEAAEVEIEDKSDVEPEQDGGEGDAPDRGDKAGDNADKATHSAPPQRTKPPDIKGFVTHLAAGLAGGLIGVIGAGVALDRLPPGALSGGSQEIQTIGRRLDALDATVAEQAKSTSGAVPEAVSDAVRALNSIEARLGVVESRPEAAAPDLNPLTERLEKLEAAFQALPAPQAAGAEDGAPAAPPPGALSKKIDDISRKLERRMASLGADIEALKSALDARPAAQVEGGQNQAGVLEARLAALEKKLEASAPDLQPLTGRLKKLEAAVQAIPAPAAEGAATGEALTPALAEKIDGVSRNLERRTGSLGADIEALQSEIAKLAARPIAPVAQISAKSDGAGLSLAFDILRRTIDRGAPFADQLGALAQAAPEKLDLSALSAYAETGVRTDGALLAELALALRVARDAAARSDDDTFLARIAANARSVVRVRRIGQSEGTDAAAVLSRMEAHMKASDLPGVLKEAEQLAGPARTSLQPWLDEALAKRAVHKALAEFERGLLARLQSGNGADKSR